MAKCHITGFLELPSSPTSTPVPARGAVLKILSGLSDNEILVNVEQDIIAGSDGSISFYATQGATLWIYANAEGLNRDPEHGTPFRIPLAATADIMVLQEDVDVPASVPVATLGNLTTGAQTISGHKTFTDKISLASVPVDQIGQPFSAYRQIGMSDGTAGTPLNTTNPTVVIERFDATVSALAAILPVVVSLTRQTGSTTSTGYNVYSRVFSSDSGATSNEMASFYGAAGGDATSKSGLKAFIGDVTVSNVLMPFGIVADFDPVNATGAAAPILSTALPAGSSIALNIAGGISGVGSQYITCGVLFQNGSSGGAQTGIHFDSQSIAPNRPALDFKYTTQGLPIRLPNLGLNATGYIYGRNNADSGDRKLLGFTSTGFLTLAGDGDPTIIGGKLDISGLTSLFKGANVASAATITPTGNSFHVTGTTTITSVSGTGITAGTIIVIIFDGALTFTDGSNLKLAGDFVTTADDTITLVYDGTNWHEVCRSVN